MDNSSLVPPKPREISLRERVLAAAGLAVFVAFLAVVAWLVTGDIQWFYLIPVGAVGGFFFAGYKPNVIWGQRVQ